jgi:hypothetical protein
MKGAVWRETMRRACGKKETSLVIPDTAEGPSKQWLSLGFREHRKA